MEKEKIVLAVFRCVCIKCLNEFDFYDLPDFLYGERLIRTKDGNDFALVKCFEDNIFQEVSEINDEFYENKNVSDNAKYDSFDKVFGLSCDPINGQELDFSFGIICPKCGSTDVDKFEYNPRKTIEIDVNLVSHNRWVRKDDDERRNLIFSALKKMM